LESVKICPFGVSHSRDVDVADVGIGAKPLLSLIITRLRAECEASNDAIKNASRRRCRKPSKRLRGFSSLSAKLIGKTTAEFVPTLARVHGFPAAAMVLLRFRRRLRMHAACWKQILGSPPYHGASSSQGQEPSTTTISKKNAPNLLIIIYPQQRKPHALL